MNYRNALTFCIQNNVDPKKALIANYVEGFLISTDLEYSDEDFENCCNFVYNWCRYSSARLIDIASLLIMLLADGEVTFDMFNNSTGYEQIENAVDDLIWTLPCKEAEI